MAKKVPNNILSANFLIHPQKVYAIIFILCFILYGNTIRNDYGFDDEYVVRNNTQVQQGIKALPEIFTTYYTAGSNTKDLYGYRPIVKASFAVERTLFGENPHMSHFFNVILYAFSGILVFVLLKKWFKKYGPIFPFLATLLFLSHPIHTEVVASLKNRDVLFSFLGGMGMLYFVTRYFESGKIIHLCWALLACTFGFFSKPDTQPYLLLIPFIGYFFTDISLKKGISVFLGLSCALTAIFLLVNMQLPVMGGRANADIAYFENPLFFQHDLLLRIGTSFNSLLTYLRMLVYPAPLLYYYGYDMIPVESILNAAPAFSLIVHAAMAVFAIMNLKKKNIVAMGIIWYLAQITIFSNLLIPAVGIVAERFVFAASLGFCVVLAYYLLKVFKINFELENKIITPKSTFVIFISILLVVLSVQTISRNRDWDTALTLFKSDIKYLHNSVKAQETIGAELMKMASKEKNKTEQDRLINESIDHYKRAIEIYPGYAMGYNNLGTFYANIFNDCEKAVPFYKKAIESDTALSEALINLGLCDARLGKSEEAIKMLEKGNERLPGKFLVSYTTLIALHFEKNNEPRAKIIFNSALGYFPNSEVPYREMAMQYLIKKDTLEAIKYFEPSLKIKSDPQLSNFIYSFLMKKGDKDGAQRFLVK